MPDQKRHGLLAQAGLVNLEEGAYQCVFHSSHKFGWHCHPHEYCLS